MRQSHRQDLAGRLSIFVNCKSCNIVKIVRKKKFICKVTVKQPVTSIKLNKTSATLNKRKSLTLITFLQKERELIAAQIMAK